MYLVDANVLIEAKNRYYGELSDWAKVNGSFFQPIDQATVANFPALTAWAASRAFTPAALAAFSGNAAGYQLVAHARGHNDVVVTHELPETNSRRRVKIPDVCAAIGTTCMSPFEVMRRTGATLVLGTRTAA